MIRFLTFLLFFFSCINSQAQIVNYDGQVNLALNNSHSQTSHLSYDFGSVATFDFDFSSTPEEELEFDFFGTADQSNGYIVNQRWNEVAAYSILFFSFILNIYLVLKVIKNRQNFTIT